MAAINTTLGAVLKLIPEIITVDPTAPLAGLKPVNVGLGRTMKFPELGTVIPLTVTEIVPVVAPDGTVAVMLLADDEVTVAETPLNETLGDTPKLEPEIITDAPAAPLEGVIPEITGVGNTENCEALIPATPLTVTDIGPDVAPEGTLTVMLVEVEAVTVAGVPLNVTVLLAGVELKLVPVIVIVVPTAPLPGLKLVMVGDGIIKLVALAPIIPFTVTEMGPVDAPKGTDVSIEVVLDVVTTALVPLKRTVFSPGMELKLVPVIVTGVPNTPVVGLKLVIDGVPNTVKFVELTTSTPLTVINIGPVPAPTGTVVVILVDVDEIN